VTNQLHQSIAVNLFERSILFQMDGKTNISDMVNKVLAQSENKQSKPDVESLCQQALIRFSQQALFI
jgi:methyltransferase-like protein